MMSMHHLASDLFWGFVATILLTTIMLGAQGLGLSRLSLPFLVGTSATASLRLAYVLGYVYYALGGWAFALLYDLFFLAIGQRSWWVGALLGFAHGAFLLTALMQLPFVHPRMASDYDGPQSGRSLEPPGFLGLNYGRQTPAVALLAHTLFGAVLGAAPPLPSLY